MAHWEAFLKKGSYSGRRKACHSGSALPTAPPLLPPPLLLRKLGALHVLLLLPSFLQKGGVVRGSRRESPALALVGSPLPLLAVRWERRGGSARVLASGGECDSAASSLLGFGVAGPSCSQESSVLACSAPPSVDSYALAERDPQSHSREVGSSAEGRFHFRSSWASLSRSRESREGCCRARLPSCGLCVRSRESHTRFMTHSRSLDEGALAGALHAPPPPECGLGGPGLGLLTSTGAVASPGMIVHCHAGPATDHVTVTGHGTGRFSPR